MRENADVRGTKIKEQKRKSKKMRKIKDMQNKDNAIQKGWNQVRVGEMKKVKEQLITKLSRNGIRMYRDRWIRLLKGDARLSLSDRESVEKIFAEQGIKEIWGIE